MRGLGTRIIQLCSLVAASAAIGRPHLASTAVACKSCVDQYTCKKTYGGVTDCWYNEWLDCTQSSTVCQGS